jgi:hypothetical protein
MYSIGLTPQRIAVLCGVPLFFASIGRSTEVGAKPQASPLIMRSISSESARAPASRLRTPGPPATPTSGSFVSPLAGCSIPRPQDRLKLPSVDGSPDSGTPLGGGGRMKCASGHWTTLATGA